LQDLAGVKMVAWQGAATDLGPEFTAICRNNTLYIENTNQEAQYQMFAEGKVEAIVIDKYIFEWWRKQYEQKSGRSEDMVYHPLFPGVNPYHIGFRDQRIRDAFDHQLILMREKGEIEGIIAAYSSSPRVSKPVASKAVTVGFGLSRPPFVLEKEQRGIAVDLAFEAFRRLGLPIRPLFMTKQRMEEQLSIGGIDIGFDVRSFSPEIFYSDPVITYHNCFVGHASQPPLRNWADLAGQRVAAWQLAEHHLGADFTAIRPQMKDYREYPVQHDQVDAWINRQTDVLLIDRNIFLWFCQQAGANAPDLSQVQIQPLPGDPGRHEAVGFRSAALRDRFTLVLRDIKADGTYSRILNRYGAGN
jgi:polar amino acid transport system substrate-binding protein